MPNNTRNPLNLVLNTPLRQVFPALVQAVIASLLMLGVPRLVVSIFIHI